MNTFARANESLRTDIGAYATALATLVRALPAAVICCDKILKETNLAQALLAFGSGPKVAELHGRMYQLQNLWPYRERPFARTQGFDEEIAEGQRLRLDAQKAAPLLAGLGNEQLAAEVGQCITNIVKYLDEQHVLLEACNAQIKPHAMNMALTRKRLTLLICAIDARVDASDEQRATLKSYRAAAALLAQWENGVPLDATGIGVLDDCLAALDTADSVVFSNISSVDPNRQVVPRAW